jgi:hypothetical protein
MSKIQRDDESATPDQVRAQEKRDAAQARADAAAEDSRKQGESEQRNEPPKDRRAGSKSST